MILWIFNELQTPVCLYKWLLKKWFKLIRLEKHLFKFGAKLNIILKLEVPSADCDSLVTSLHVLKRRRRTTQNNHNFKLFILFLLSSVIFRSLQLYLLNSFRHKISRTLIPEGNRESKWQDLMILLKFFLKLKNIK